MIKLRPDKQSQKKIIQYQEVDTRLQGRKLLLARIIWGIAVTLVTGFTIILMPEYIATLKTVCAGSQCNDGQITSSTIQTLQQLHFSLDGYVTYQVILALIFIVVSSIVAGVLVWRKSNDWMALLIAFFLIFYSTGVITGVFYGSNARLALLANFLNLLAFTDFFLMFALFPDGRFVPRWTRLLPVGYFIENVIILALPLNIAALPQTPIFIALGGLLWFGFSGGALFAQIYRFIRVSGPVQRQQTKWIVYGFAMSFLFDFLTWLPRLLFPGFGQPGSLYDLFVQALTACVELLLPLSIGIAILRYRLYDIDVLINRTLVYGSLTILLVLIYLGGVIGLEALLHTFTQSSDLAIVGSTLAIAALFQPLRRSIQKIIDRRFYRSKYNAAQTLANFSTTLRGEVDLTQLSDHLVNVVNETMQPKHVSLWLRNDEKEKRTVS